MGSNEETNAAGTDTRPPMLVESDYDSWKIRIHRKKIDSEFNKMKTNLEMVVTQAEIILSQRSSQTHLQQPKQTSIAKEIWEISYSTQSLQPHAKRLQETGESYNIVIHWPILPLKWFPKAVSHPPINQLRIPPTQGLMLRCIDGHIGTRGKESGVWGKGDMLQLQREGHVASSVKNSTQEKAGLSSHFMAQLVIRLVQPTIQSMRCTTSNDQSNLDNVEYQLRSGDAPGRTIRLRSETEI
ncbi:hypothetical protein Tco_0770984 [Tanacetum coccineum]|uniref:Uncharacterized protein n=1 Tax=Tanacetum coccineum TaxID=301880 RepID=A0ABQ4ZDP7_9ASTR